MSLGPPRALGQIVLRMSRGQAGDQAYLYLATASVSDLLKVPGTIAKCALDADGLATVDFAACASAGTIAGLATSSIAVR